MKSTLVAFYSRTGSNHYLANKIASTLNCDIEPINPRPGIFSLLLLLSWSKIGAFSKISSAKLDQYERIIVCGPIWMGTLISPLKGLLNKLKKTNHEVCYVTCCGSTDQKKDDTFGYATVFPLVRKMVGDRLILSEAFPIDLVIPEDQKGNDEIIMNTRLSDENFNGEIQDRFNRLINKLQNQPEMARILRVSG